jgi:hypothetical protein
MTVFLSEKRFVGSKTYQIAAKFLEGDFIH